MYGNAYDSRKTRLSHLNRIIDNYILAQHGIKNNVVKDDQLDGIVKRSRREKTKELLLKEEIEDKVKPPTNKDLKKLFSLKGQKVRVKHLFTDTKQEIDSLYRLLQQGKSFESIAFDIFRDSTLKFTGGDLGWKKFGDLDPFLEDVAYNLEPDSISKPVQSRFGWHILKVKNRTYQPLKSEYDFKTKKSDLKKQYIRREQNKRYYRYINSFMEDKTAVIKNPEWSIVARELRKRFPQDKKLSPMLMQSPHSPEFGEMTPEIKDIINNTIISFPNKNLTVAEFLELVPSVPAKLVYRSIRQVTERIIRDYFLVKEGQQRGLHNDIAVAQHATFRKNLKAGAIYRNKLLQDNRVSPDSIDELIVQAKYDSLKNSQFIEKQTFDYSILVAKDSLVRKKVDSLIQTGNFSDAVTNYGLDKFGVLESGRLKKDRSEVPGIIRNKLLNIEDNKISRWMKINTKPVLLKRHSVNTKYKPFEDTQEKLRERISYNKSVEKVNKILSKPKEDADIKIYEKRLYNLWGGISSEKEVPSLSPRQ